MKALVKTASRARASGWRTSRSRKVGPNDVLIEIAKTAICGTDMHIYNWDAWAQKTIPVPMAVGHEYCGAIVEIGSEVRGLQDRRPRLRRRPHHLRLLPQLPRRAPPPVPQHHRRRREPPRGASPSTCRSPRSTPSSCPTSIGDDIASILDPFGNAMHTALAFNMVGEDVLITGAGPIGIMAVAIARFVGARHVVITDVNDYRLELARKMGATRAVNVHARLARRDDEGPRHAGRLRRRPGDVGQRRRPCARCCAPCTTAAAIAILGIPPEDTAIDWNQVIFKGLTLKGIYGREMFETWYKMASLLQSGLKLEPDHHASLRRCRSYMQGFETMGSGKSGKVILDWSTLP